MNAFVEYAWLYRAMISSENSFIPLAAVMLERELNLSFVPEEILRNEYQMGVFKDIKVRRKIYPKVLVQ